MRPRVPWRRNGSSTLGDIEINGKMLRFGISTFLRVCVFVCVCVCCVRARAPGVHVCMLSLYSKQSRVLHTKGKEQCIE